MTFNTLLVWVSAAEGIGLLGLSILLLLHAAGLRLRDLFNKPRLARARSSLVEAMETGRLESEDFHRLNSLSRQNQITLFSELVPNLRGSQQEWLKAQADKMGLIAWADCRCKSRWWWRRLQGVRLHTLLGSGEAAVPPLLMDGNPAVQAQAAEWATEHPNPRVIVALLLLLNRSSGLSRFAVQDCLLRMGSPVVEPLRANLSNLSGRRAIGALEVAIGLASPQFLAGGLALCHDKSARVRALAATLLGALGGSDSVDMLMESLRDRDAQVRVAAASALGKLGHWPAAPAIAPLLRDPTWEVRREAGLALRSFGPPGSLLLQRALLDDWNPAASMARQVLDIPDPAPAVR